MKPVSLLLVLLACLLSGAKAQNYNLMSSETSDVPLTDSVQYSCLFKNLWTSTRHPVTYPSFAHWSPIVLVAHSEDYTMWEEGELASPGVENVAEVSK
jgi:steroid 5-alpha reductase family enzyme